MHCLDCGSKLETANYVESCTQWLCKNCNAYWYQSRTIVVQWSKKNISLDSNNGGINAPTTSIGEEKSWYKQAQELHQSLLRQDKVIDDFRRQVKELKVEKERTINLDNKLELMELTIKTHLATLKVKYPLFLASLKRGKNTFLTELLMYVQGKQRMD